MSTTFVYCPRSGDRIFAALAVNGVVLIRWPNGCSHVVGGTHLSWGTAAPGEHWRDLARAIATRLVETFGGVAWDEQGAVHMVVPPHTSGTVEHLVRATRIRAVHRHREEYDDTSNAVACLLAGTMHLDPETQHPCTSTPTPRNNDLPLPTFLRRLPQEEADPEETQQAVVVTVPPCGEEGEEQFYVLAPVAWGEPLVYGASLDSGP